MIGWVYELFINEKLLFLQGILTVPVTILIIILFFLKSSRDERGRAIIGRASIYATIYFIVIINIFSYIMQKPYVIVEFYFTSNMIAFIYNSLILIESCIILILNRIS